MPTILIATDFSAASRHALDYAGVLLRGREVTIDLLHIFPIPVTYTSDGVALAAVQDAIERAADRMQEEVSYFRKAYPAIRIEGRVITGGFLTTLRQEARLVHPLFLILGTAGFADLYLGDDDPLNALRTVQCPVLFIPQGAALKPVRQVLFASNYQYAGPRIPAGKIISWMDFLTASMQVVSVSPQAMGEDAARGRSWLQQAFAPVRPQFSEVQDTEVIHGLAGFISSHPDEVDCVMVVPRKYGIWQNLFHNSRTKALARLNRVPVIAFPEVG